MASKFEDSIDFVLRNEGGLVDNPKDPGGLTNFGISQRRYPNLDIRNLTVDQAKEIYKRDYWLFDGIAYQAVATKLFDAYVNMGHTAIKLAQAIVGATQDGFYGANTEARINAMDPVKFLGYYRIWLVQHYQDIVLRHPDQAVFLKGWLRRANL